MKFEEVSFDMIGCGGLSGDKPLIEVGNEDIQHISRVIFDEDRDDHGTITIKLKVKKIGESSLVIEPSVSISEPKKSLKSLSAIVSGGKAVTQDHRQTALDLDNVSPIKRGEN